jgi:hypothetical protein
MPWSVDIGDELDAEWNQLPVDVQNEILAHGKLLAQFGPQLGRPRVDTLNGSRHANMKELRFDAASGGWRLHSIHAAGQYCWSPATSPAWARSGFTSN